MELVTSFLILAIPLAVNVLAVACWRGGYRMVALVPLPFLAGAYAMDLYGSIRGGNLAGILTILTAPPALLLLLGVVIARMVTRGRAGRGPDEGGPE